MDVLNEMTVVLTKVKYGKAKFCLDVSGIAFLTDNKLKISLEELENLQTRIYSDCGIKATVKNLCFYFPF